MWPFQVCKTHTQFLLALRISIEKSGIILMGLPIHMMWSLLLAVSNLFSLFSTFSVLIIVCCREFLFESYLFDLLYASSLLIVTSFFRFRSGFYFPISIIDKFGLFIMPQISWMFCAWNFIDLFTYVSIYLFIRFNISSTFYSISDILPPMSCNLLLRLTSELMFDSLKFFIFQFYFSCSCP